MQLQNIITFDILSYFLTKLRNEISSTYVSKTTSITGPVYIGVGDNVTEVYTNANLRDNDFPKKLNLSFSDDYLYVIYPASNTKSIIIKVSNIIVPTDNLQTVTLDESSYYVLKSSNAYSYSGEVNFSVE